MRFGGVHFGPHTLTLAVAVAVALTGVGCLLFDATPAVQAVGVLVGSYLVASLFLHPRHSLVSDPFAIHNLLRINLLIGGVFSCLYVSSPEATFNEDLILLGLAITLLTAVLADIGVFFLPSTVPGSEPEQEPGNPVVFRLLLALFVAGWAWRIFAFTHGYLQGTLIGAKLELTGSSNLFGTLNSVSTLAMWGCVVFVKRPLRAAPLVATEILWLLVTGSKAATLYILVPFILVLYRRGRVRVDGRFVTAVVALVIVFAASFVVIHGYRVAVAKQIYRVGYEELDPLAAVGDIEVDPADFRLVGQALTERLNFAERFLIIMAKDRIDPREPWWGRSYLTAVLWAVPRAAWPDKPMMSLGRYYATEYLGWGEESRSEAGITLWGEGYLNYGILGAAAVPGLWMILLQTVYVLAIRSGRWGLYYITASFMIMNNSLSANVAIAVANLSQLALLVLTIRLVLTVPAQDDPYFPGADPWLA